MTSFDVRYFLAIILKDGDHLIIPFEVRKMMIKMFKDHIEIDISSILFFYILFNFHQIPIFLNNKKGWSIKFLNSFLI